MAKHLPVDVIVPVYKDVGTTLSCLRSLEDSKLKKKFRIIVINDHSPEKGMQPALERFAGQCSLPVKLICNSKNLGFTGSVNKGMAISPYRHVVLLNSDTQVAPGWLDRLSWHGENSGSIASVTPFSNNATIASFPRFCLYNKLPTGISIEQLDSIFAGSNRHQSVEIPTAVGFCMWINRLALNQLGSFDEQNFPKGYGEENDFSRRAVGAGWSNLLAADVYVWHEGGVSFGETARALQQKNGKRLSEMYPNYDQVVQSFIAQDPIQEYRQKVLAELGRRSDST